MAMPQSIDDPLRQPPGRHAADGAFCCSTATAAAADGRSWAHIVKSARANNAAAAAAAPPDGHHSDVAHKPALQASSWPTATAAICGQVHKRSPRSCAIDLTASSSQSAGYARHQHALLSGSACSPHFAKAAGHASSNAVVRSWIEVASSMTTNCVPAHHAVVCDATAQRPAAHDTEAANSPPARTAVALTSSHSAMTGVLLYPPVRCSGSSQSSISSPSSTLSFSALCKTATSSTTEASSMVTPAAFQQLLSPVPTTLGSSATTRSGGDVAVVAGCMAAAAVPAGRSWAMVAGAATVVACANHGVQPLNDCHERSVAAAPRLATTPSWVPASSLTRQGGLPSVTHSSCTLAATSSLLTPQVCRPACGSVTGRQKPPMRAGRMKAQQRLDFSSGHELGSTNSSNHNHQNSRSDCRRSSSSSSSEALMQVIAAADALSMSSAATPIIIGSAKQAAVPSIPAPAHHACICVSTSKPPTQQPEEQLMTNLTDLPFELLLATVSLLKSFSDRHSLYSCSRAMQVLRPLPLSRSVLSAICCAVAEPSDVSSLLSSNRQWRSLRDEVSLQSRWLRRWRADPVLTALDHAQAAIAHAEDSGCRQTALLEGANLLLHLLGDSHTSCSLTAPTAKRLMLAVCANLAHPSWKAVAMKLLDDPVAPHHHDHLLHIIHASCKRRQITELIQLLLSRPGIFRTLTIPLPDHGAPISVAMKSACFSNQHKVVSLLLRSGVHPNWRYSSRHLPHTVVQVFDRIANPTGSVWWPLKEQTVVAGRFEGQRLTMLQWLCAYSHNVQKAWGRATVCTLLAAPNIDINASIQSDGCTALHLAAEAGNVAMMHLLLKQPSIDIHIRNLEGYTAEEWCWKQPGSFLISQVFYYHRCKLASQLQHRRQHEAQQDTRRQQQAQKQQQQKGRAVMAVRADVGRRQLSGSAAQPTVAAQAKTSLSVQPPSCWGCGEAGLVLAGKLTAPLFGGSLWTLLPQDLHASTSLTSSCANSILNSGGELHTGGSYPPAASAPMFVFGRKLQSDCTHAVDTSTTSADSTGCNKSKQKHGIPSGEACSGIRKVSAQLWSAVTTRSAEQKRALTPDAVSRLATAVQGSAVKSGASDAAPACKRRKVRVRRRVQLPIATDCTTDQVPVAASADATSESGLQAVETAAGATIAAAAAADAASTSATAVTPTVEASVTASCVAL